MTVERELGRLAGELAGLAKSIDDKHKENREHMQALSTQIHEHDQRDHNAFEEIFRRLKPLENHAAGASAIAAREREEAEHDHTWRITKISAGATLIAALFGAVVTWFVMHH